MNGKLIVLEGIDGSGKATQSGLLEDHLIKRGKDVMHISFPDYGSPSSALVKMYLNGDFGRAPGDVNPYAASMLYAVDRFASFRMKWKSFYENGGVVIADRYTTSNMVHQMTKYDDEGKRKEFLSWLDHMEYEELELPRPDVVILLDVPPAVSKNWFVSGQSRAGLWISMSSIRHILKSAVMRTRYFVKLMTGCVFPAWRMADCGARMTFQRKCLMLCFPGLDNC